MHLYAISRIGRFIETESRLMVFRACGKEELGLTANRYGVSFGGDGKVLGRGTGCMTGHMLKPTGLYASKW